MTITKRREHIWFDFSYFNIHPVIDKIMETVSKYTAILNSRNLKDAL